VKVSVDESGKGNGKVKGGHNVLPINLLPYLAEAYLASAKGKGFIEKPKSGGGCVQDKPVTLPHSHFDLILWSHYSVPHLTKAQRRITY
jgi:hypothetical protein